MPFLKYPRKRRRNSQRKRSLRKMNRKQKVIIIIGVCLSILLIIYPPLHPVIPRGVNSGLLAIRLAVVVLATFGLTIAFKDKRKD